MRRARPYNSDGLQEKNLRGNIKKAELRRYVFILKLLLIHNGTCLGLLKISQWCLPTCLKMCFKEKHQQININLKPFQNHHFSINRWHFSGAIIVSQYRIHVILFRRPVQNCLLKFVNPVQYSVFLNRCAPTHKCLVELLRGAAKCLNILENLKKALLFSLVLSLSN